ncbi:MAG: hypothetical protein KKE01_07920 [Candidatus Omnitrophica bacterium]|nr:hypothetical protein [Candidatus Omnitrophota bacterium]
MDLYQNVLGIAKSYIGLAAGEYIERRCRVSLNLANPEDFKKTDIERLAEGIAMTAGAYMSEEKVKKFKDEILKLKETR